MDLSRRRDPIEALDGSPELLCGEFVCCIALILSL